MGKKHFFSSVSESSDIYLKNKLSFFGVKSIPLGDFPGGPVVKNLPCNAGNVGSIPGRGTKTSQAAEQLSPGTQLENPCTTTTVFLCHN